MATPAEEALEALGKVPIPIERVEGGYILGPGARYLMQAWDAAYRAVHGKDT